MLLERVPETSLSDSAGIKGFQLEPRCRVCRNNAVRIKVNDLLTNGASYAMVLRALEGDNAKLDTRERVTIDSIRNHTSRHFPVQNVAKATYRAILEIRAKQNGVDFVNGLATAITPMAFLETVMVRSYETLVDSDTKVDVGTGMIAAGRLQAMIDSRASGPSMAEILAEVGQIIHAVKTTVPKSMWDEIASKLDRSVNGVEPPVDEDSDVFDPDDESLEDDELDQLVN
jgi:hypothetical protein